MKISARSKWGGLGTRLVLALAAAVIVPACGKTKTIMGTPGPQGPAGLDQNPPAQWADPVNVSVQAATVGLDAFGQQAVFTPDGRMHVVYVAHDVMVSDEDQLWYTSAAAPYNQWDAPVQVTDDNEDWYGSPQGFDIAASSNNSVNIVYSRNRYYNYQVTTVATGGVYTLSPPSTPTATLSVGDRIYFYNFSTNAANNGYYNVTAIAGNVITTDNGSSVADTTGEGNMQAYATSLMYARNTAAQRGEFTQSLVFNECYGTGSIYSGRILMRGSTAHIVWTGQNPNVVNDGYGGFYYAYTNSGQTWPATTGAYLPEHPEDYVGNSHYAFVSDAAGNFHLAYDVFRNWDDGPRCVAYRMISAFSSSLSAVQQVSNYTGDEYLAWDADNGGPPIVQFDGSNNVYVFWKRRSESGWSGIPAVMCNIKPSYGAFNAANAAVVSQDPTSGDWLDDNHLQSPGNYVVLSDVQVAADGRIHAAWREEVYVSDGWSYYLYPIYYRTKDPGLNASSGWQQAQLVAYANEYYGDWNNDMDAGGMNRTVLVRADGDGNPHVFWSNRVTVMFDYAGPTIYFDASYDLMHSYLPAGGTTWYSGGNAMGPSNLALNNARNYAYNYFIDAGVEEDGSPFVLAAVDPNVWLYPMWQFDYVNSDIVYTHRWAGEWSVGVDVNGPDQIEAYGWFWAGRDAEGKLHLLWQQDASPFGDPGSTAGFYDVMHSNSPVVSGNAWNKKQSDARLEFPTGPSGGP